MKITPVLFLLLSGCSFALLSCDSFTDPFSETEQESTFSGSASSSSTEEEVESNQQIHEEESDYIWSESEIIDVSLNGSSASTSGSGISIDGSTITITSAGVYRFTGSLEDGQIVVETEDTDPVKVLLNGVDIHHSSNAAIAVLQAERTIIVALDGTQNMLSDGSSYTFESDEDEPNATLFSKDDVTIYGTGSITIDANYNDAIASKDGLIIRQTTLNINAVDDGIRGKDYAVISDAVITISSEGDGIKSDNDEESDRGYILIESGTFVLDVANDALQAATDLLIKDGNFELTSGGGSSNSYSSSESQKALKATSNIVIDGGTFRISSADDAIHSNSAMTINDGSFEISSGDDGIHADTSITINYGNFSITKSYEGIESRVIVINDGYFDITTSDDGLNVAGGNDQSSGGRPGGWSTGSSASSNYYLIINGGFITVRASGDGLDANGSIEMTGGVVLVHGPTSNSNGAIDYDGSFLISGGTLIAAGSAGMVRAPGSSSDQYSAYIRFSSTKSAGTTIHLESESGESLFTFQFSKSTQGVVMSLPEFSGGNTYKLYSGGSTSGEQTGGLFDDDDFTGGSLSASFTLNNKITSATGS